MPPGFSFGASFSEVPTISRGPSQISDTHRNHGTSTYYGSSSTACANPRLIVVVEERVLRSVKSTQPKVRPDFVFTDDPVRAHVFPCMLARYLEWHSRQKWAPLLFKDDNRAAARARSTSPVAKADIWDAARRKPRRKITAAGQSALRLRTLLKDLAALTRNEVTLSGGSGQPFILFAGPTRPQAEAFQRLVIESAESESGSATGCLQSLRITPESRKIRWQVQPGRETLQMGSCSLSPSCKLATEPAGENTLHSFGTGLRAGASFTLRMRAYRNNAKAGVRDLCGGWAAISIPTATTPDHDLPRRTGSYRSWQPRAFTP